MTQPFQRPFRFTSAEQTLGFAQRLAPALLPGDVLLLKGDLGAGKTHFARGVIQARLALAGLAEDVPSPTFTLVQTYDDTKAEIWHADLYRLSSVDEVYELGLDEAFHNAICLIEWPDRLGQETPPGALTLDFSMTDQIAERVMLASSDNPRWAAALDVADE